MQLLSTSGWNSKSGAATGSSFCTESTVALYILGVTLKECRKKCETIAVHNGPFLPLLNDSNNDALVVITCLDASPAFLAKWMAACTRNFTRGAHASSLCDRPFSILLRRPRFHVAWIATTAEYSTLSNRRVSHSTAAALHFLVTNHYLWRRVSASTIVPLGGTFSPL